jgi:DinB superfamily
MRLDDFRFEHYLTSDAGIGAAVAGMSTDQLHDLTIELYDALTELCASVDNATVHAVTEEGTGEQAWTFGHVILHLAATCEEGAARASALARGADASWRSRYEPDWREFTTAEQIRERLAESRRMVLAFFGTWPSAPHLDGVVTPIPALGPVNAIGIHLLGLMHAWEHLPHLVQLSMRRT